jgi:kumamolisin
MSAGDFIAEHAPLDADVTSVGAFLKAKGFVLERTATNKCLFEFSGTIGSFNGAFGTTIHTYAKHGDMRAATLSHIYAPVGGTVLPSELGNVHADLLTIDPPTDPTPLAVASTTISTTPPPNLSVGLVPQQIAKAYGFDDLALVGGNGKGTTIGLVVAQTVKEADVQSFWQTFGLMRKSPQLREVMEAPSTRVLESTLDVEWAGMLAPEAEPIVYEAPDVRDTALLYTFNEAVGLAEATVISNSFGHRQVAPDGTFERETAWFAAGAGVSKYFPKPVYQKDVAPDSGGKRAVADLSQRTGLLFHALSPRVGRAQRHVVRGPRLCGDGRRCR